MKIILEIKETKLGVDFGQPVFELNFVTTVNKKEYLEIIEKLNLWGEIEANIDTFPEKKEGGK